MDRHDAATRSKIMSQIRRENTRPEIMLRKALFAAGARGYRLHAALPGRPDVVFAGAKVAVFTDGCFWHRCRKCAIPFPRSNRSYWLPKLARNVERDRAVTRGLRRDGWLVLRFWEHDVFENTNGCVRRILDAISPGRPRSRRIRALPAQAGA
jgi:DNA mismatch endonuclease (patch repair protein)